MRKKMLQFRALLFGSMVATLVAGHAMRALTEDGFDGWALAAAIASLLGMAVLHTLLVIAYETALTTSQKKKEEPQHENPYGW